MLDAEQVQKVRLMFSTAGWIEVVKPAIENRLRQRIKALILHPSERGPDPRDDGAIRGEIESLEWLLMSLQNELTAAEVNRIADELRREEEAESAGTLNGEFPNPA